MKKRRIAMILASLSLVTLTLGSCGTIAESQPNNNSQNETGEKQTEGTSQSGNENQGGNESQGETAPVVQVGAIKLKEYKGVSESVYATWEKQAGITDYNVYIKESTDSNYKVVDKQLIREYSDFYRVDVLGLKEGSYDLKIVSVLNDKEESDSATSVSNINVISHDRSGFGFVNGSSSGAYNDDGTLKTNARVIYVTNQTKDTVETSAIVSKQTVNVKGIQNIIAAMKSQKGITDPICVRFIGNILDPANMEKGDLYVDGVKNLTIEGIGNDTTMNGFGIVIKNSSNVEIRNLGFMNCNSKEGDDCGLQQSNDHIWVHNCDFFYGDAGSDADQIKGDGALDTKKSTYVTHSYNHFWDNGKCNLQGMKEETAQNYITYHHNWYDHSDSRHPRVRTCTVHIYNNYFDGNAKYGIASAMGASIFAENNYFRSTTNTIPFITGQMGHDIKDDGTTTLSSEYGGVIKEFGNVFDGSNFRYTKYSDDNNNFDAYNASSRDEKVSSTVKSPANVVYNNFDTDSSIMYTYTVQTASEAKESVIKYAGRVDGGDFKWTFTNDDDAKDEVDSALKQALTKYKDNIVRTLGISVDATQTEGENVTTEPEVTDTPIAVEGTYVKTFDNGTTDTVFKITANLKSGVAIKTYDGVNYTTAIKMESSTSIKFSISEAKKLVIITDTSAKNIKIDGEKVLTNSSGVVEIELSSGSHEIIKGDSMNVYAFILK